MARIITALTALAFATAVITTVVVGGGASQNGEVASAAPAAPARAPVTASAAIRRDTVTVRRSRYGRVLFDGRGRALYLFTRERGTTPRCYGACAQAWPPFLTSGRPSAARGARGSLVGTTRRRDGSRQVTYRGRPLYYYVGDRRAGQILCQNVVEFGGTWLVVSPSGRAVQ
jgi:predicted lipoprotein with Yx(FWY)xxD motif